MTYGTARAKETAAVIRKHIGKGKPDAAIILGSGLGRLADKITDRTVVAYQDVPGFPSPTVVGHSGAVVAGMLGGRRVVALSGRFHMYEGHGPDLAGFPVRVLRELGAETLVVTNAAGGIRRSFKPGDIMLIRDHINLMFRNPLTGGVEQGDERFPDMSDPYDPGLIRLAREVAKSQGVALAEGVYCGLLGPTYETPAEVRMLTTIGADAVGMSTVPEVIVARARGMRVLGFSCITNLASGLSDSPITHAEVLETTLIAGEKMSALVAEIVKRLPLIAPGKE
jgi:purine-nucleoside phosphorylase